MTVSAPRWDMTNVYPSLDSKQFKNAVKSFKSMLDSTAKRVATLVKTEKI